MSSMFIEFVEFRVKRHLFYNLPQGAARLIQMEMDNGIVVQLYKEEVI